MTLRTHMTILRDIRRIAIVGAGPAGIAAAKHMLAETKFTTVDVFDQQSKAGGVWDYVSANNSHSTCNVPQTSPNVPLQTPIWLDECGKRRATYVSPVYDRLEANIPKTLMQHSDMPFPDSVPLYASHDEIEDYLEEYASSLKHLVQFETQVTRIDPVITTNSQQLEWTVHTKHLPTSTTKSSTYDAILVASGHYNVPHIPNIANIAEFNARYSPSTSQTASKPICNITHSKAYSSPEAFHGLKTLVIGSGPSAVDIAAQIATRSLQPLFISTRAEPSPHSIVASAHYVPEIAEFLMDDSSAQRAVRLKDGTIIADLDAIVFCTGYIYAYPFLPCSLEPGASLESFAEFPLITTGERVRNVYKHIFYTPAPSLAFLTLPWSIIPFPLAESQAALVSRVWSGKITLPSLDEMRAWEAQTVADKGDGKAFHKLAPPQDVDYINELHSWCLGSPAERSESTVNGTRKTGGGRPEPPHWGKYMRALRLALPKIKKAYVDLGEGRRQVKTLQELGFEFDEESGEMVDRRAVDDRH